MSIRKINGKDYEILSPDQHPDFGKFKDRFVHIIELGTHGSLDLWLMDSYPNTFTSMEDAEAKYGLGTMRVWEKHPYIAIPLQKE